MLQTLSPSNVNRIVLVLLTLMVGDFEDVVPISV